MRWRSLGIVHNYFIIQATSKHPSLIRNWHSTMDSNYWRHSCHLKTRWHCSRRNLSKSLLVSPLRRDWSPTLEEYPILVNVQDTKEFDGKDETTKPLDIGFSHSRPRISKGSKIKGKEPTFIIIVTSSYAFTTGKVPLSIQTVPNCCGDTESGLLLRVISQLSNENLRTRRGVTPASARGERAAKSDVSDIQCRQLERLGIGIATSLIT